MIKESITNEWAEFLAYTKEPTYAVRNKKDNGFLGRFTMDMLMENYGFARILTVLARGYLFHSPDGTPKGGDPYDRTDDARRFLCAWSSIPDKKNATPRVEWQFKTDFRELHSEFSELVDEDGCGWYIRHLHGIADFINANRDKVGKSTHHRVSRFPATLWRENRDTSSKPPCFIRHRRRFGDVARSSKKAFKHCGAAVESLIIKIG